MKISKIKIENFKRFTDLTIQNIPKNSKLVLLTGSNGSGKSSLFDAFEFVSRPSKGGGHYSKDYYFKNPSKKLDVTFSFHDCSGIYRRIKATGQQSYSQKTPQNSFLGRSSTRITERLYTNQKFNIQDNTVSHDTDAPKRFIDYDFRFENDLLLYILNINQELRKPLFLNQAYNPTKLFNTVIRPINDSLKRIFAQENHIEIIDFKEPSFNKPPLLIFKKGNSRVNYHILSHGEKQIVMLLLNFVVRSRTYSNTIYFIDEMDLHINTRLQYNLIKDVVENWINGQSQIWTASHSLGFLEYANSIENSTILNFGCRDFDLTQIIEPSDKSSLELYNISIPNDFLVNILNNAKLIFVENKDSNYYSQMQNDKYIFCPLHDKYTVYHRANSSKNIGLIDRDFLTECEIKEIEVDYPNIRVLRYYSIENYLYHPDNVEEYSRNVGMKFDKKQYIESIKKARNKIQDKIPLKLVSTRASYPFYKEPNSDTKKVNRFKIKSSNEESASQICKILKSKVFEEFYKVIPMKDINFPDKGGLNKLNLSKTNWFRNKITGILSKSMSS